MSDSKEILKRFIKPGDHIGVVYVKRFMDQEQFKLLNVRDGAIEEITLLAARAGGWNLKNENIIVDGGNMDLGAELVIDLGQILYDDPRAFTIDRIRL
ncbi:MAG: hypothetical protein H8E32_01875 [Nitrospinae bacterium]|nr:hypothetical protein [Nitrospinota bacterium]